MATNSAGTTLGADQTVTTASGGLTSVPMTYVTNAPLEAPRWITAPPSIVGFPAGAHGNLAPSVTISGPRARIG
jgi:hypothetical protein